MVVRLAIREFTEKHRGFFFGMGIRHSGQVRISPSCRLYEPEAESKSLVGGVKKDLLGRGDILNGVSIIHIASSAR
ncbi:MAG: hypothetical protein JRF50_03280 [Deltaproteobacteria bacterium]|nr:hypothetical protein [Deltaproteobacteria bacterium]